jgi:2-phosphoglycerate kinase
MKERIGKGKSRRMRQRLLNFWSIMTFHRILVHKARFYGVPVIFGGSAEHVPGVSGMRQSE